MKWTNVIHVLIDKLGALIQVISQLILLVQVLVKLLEQQSKDSLCYQGEEEQKKSIEVAPEHGYLDSELMTVKETMAMLKLSRWKVYDFLAKGTLTRLKKKDGGRRFIRKEVEELRYSYAVKKGKV